MFFKLVSRNSRRSRKENSLFFSSLVISIVAFYIILSLPKQDVMLFLNKMESDAVNRLMTLIPAFYGLTLLILFFLIYYAGKFYLDRRRHEFGVYLMLGMRRFKLFAMILLEDVRSSAAALLLGIPTAVLLSELISLVTAKLVGIGIIGHYVSFSPEAVLWTAAGFLAIKFLAFLILSGKISRQEIGTLLADEPEGGKKRLPSLIYKILMLAGVLFLAGACVLAVNGTAWQRIDYMGITLLLGFSGMFLVFYGLRFFIGRIVKRRRKRGRLHVFNFRQIEETVICRSHTLAVCALLILASMCCFGAGVAIARFYGASQPHILDYTFRDRSEGARHNGMPGEGGQNEVSESTKEILKILSDSGLEGQFCALFEMKVGHIRTTEDDDTAFSMDSVMEALAELPESDDRRVILNQLGYATYPYLISLSGYNALRKAAREPELTLDSNEAAVYMDSEFMTEGRRAILNKIFGAKPEVFLDKESLHLTGDVQTLNLVTDRSITLSFALILPDERFAYYTQGDYETYVNGILDAEVTKEKSLMQAISKMNEELQDTGLEFESYLQNMGRQLFYMVAASYLTIYLAIIFLIIANTMIGVQFLMGQQKSGRRYRTLVCLGATYEILCRSVKSQIHWYFGMPTVIAVVCSFFGVRSLFTGLLSARAEGSLSEMMLISGIMIFVLCVVEWIYISTVKRAGCKYLLTIMEPKRGE